jgi:hypothetical protein
MLRLSSPFPPVVPILIPEGIPKAHRRLSEETENIDKQVNGQFPIGEKEEKPLTSGIEDVRGEF